MTTRTARSRIHVNAAARQQAVEVVEVARRARDTQDWGGLVDILGEHWSILFDEEPELLDDLLRDTPVNAFQKDARAAAIRDIRMHTSFDSVDRMLGATYVPDARDVAELESIARSERALPLLSVAASRMIAFRVRGFMQRALDLAHLTERLGRIGAVHNPTTIGPRLPSTLLQVGITRGLADDLHGAATTLRDAYEQAPAARVDFVAQDAAGKAAFFFALSGDLDHAKRWLTRYDEQDRVESWWGPRIQLTATLARSLVATESLDREEAERGLSELEPSMNFEQNWNPALTFVAARHALAWGDRLRALERVGHDRKRYGEWLQPGTTLGPLLAQAESDLRLSVGQVSLGARALDGFTEHPVGRVARAKTLLVAGRHDTAARAAAKAVAEGHSARTRTDALAVRVVANLRRGDTEIAATASEHLSAAIEATQLQLIGMTLSAGDNQKLGREPADPNGARESIPAGTALVLTNQQRLVRDGLARGRSLKAIAAQAQLSQNTIKTHVRALYARLGVSSKHEAVEKAYEAGLL